MNGTHSIDNWPGYGDDGRHVFKDDAQVKMDSIMAWSGYGDQRKDVSFGF
jgi:hypothetical protein